SAHVLHNEDQQLYRKCAQSDCGRAACDIGPETIPLCVYHRKSNALRILEKAKEEKFQISGDQKQAGKGKKTQRAKTTDGTPSDSKKKRKKPNAKSASQDVSAELDTGKF